MLIIYWWTISQIIKYTPCTSDCKITFSRLFQITFVIYVCSKQHIQRNLFGDFTSGVIVHCVSTTHISFNILNLETLEISGAALQRFSNPILISIERAMHHSQDFFQWKGKYNLLEHKILIFQNINVYQFL